MNGVEPQKEGPADRTGGQAESWAMDGCRTVTIMLSIRLTLSRELVTSLGRVLRPGAEARGSPPGLRATPGSSEKPVQIALPVLPVDFADPIRVQEYSLQRLPYQLLGLVKPEVPRLPHLLKAHAIHNFATAGVATYEGVCMNPGIEKPG